MSIISKSSINMLARMDAIEYDSGCIDSHVPLVRYSTSWMQELYKQYFWSNLEDLRGKGVIYEGA